MPTATWEGLDEAKRQRVLTAAMREFGAHGFSPGSLNVVAREAGVAKGSLFQYFADKTELYAYVCEHVSTAIRDEMQQRIDERIPRDTPFFDRVVGMAALWAEYFADHPLERGVTAATNLEIDPEVRVAVRQVAHRQYREVLDPLLRHAVERGELVEGADLEVLAAYLLWLFPHLAIAPELPALDPVLGLHGQTPAQVRDTAERLVAPLRAAFGAHDRVASPA